MDALQFKSGISQERHLVLISLSRLSFLHLDQSMSARKPENLSRSLTRQAEEAGGGGDALHPGPGCPAVGGGGPGVRPPPPDG